MRQARLASISFVGLVSGGLESVHLHVHINVHQTFVQYHLVGYVTAIRREYACGVHTG